MDILHSLLPTIENFHILGYWIAFFFALLETVIGIGLFVPGSTALLFMGGLSAGGSFDIGDLIFFAICGAIIGDNINYYIGRKFGSKIFSKGFLFIKPKQLKKSREFLNKHGAKSVFLGRFIPSLKEITPLVAGTLKMKRLTFTIWNILGAIGWSLIWILPGYFFAQSIDIAKLWLTRTGFFFLFMVIFLVLVYILKYVFIRKGQKLFKFLKSLFLSIKQGVLENQEIKEYKNKHPKLFEFIKKRFAKNIFSGRTTTVLFFAFIYILLLFGGVIEGFINSSTIVAVDVRVSHLLLLFRDAELIKVFLWITILGKSAMVLLISGSTILILWLVKKRNYILPFITTVVGSVAFNYLGKLFFHRPRPEMPVYIENSFSFPSGHATIAIALFGFLTYLLIREIKTWKNKINIFFVGLLLISLIGFSRLYLGVHYVSDVWSGYLLGLLWLIIGISITEYIFSKQKLTKNELITKKNKIISWLVILFCIFVYVVLAFNYNPVLSTVDNNQDISTLAQPSDIFLTTQLRYTETLTGVQQEPISFIILAKNDKQFIELFNKSGWKLANRIDVPSMVRIISAAIYKKSYDTAPMTPYFWNTKTHDFGFEKPTEVDNVRQRHHARFWKTNYSTENGFSIYIGTASFDQNIKWGITHQISPDIDTEREILFTDLENSGAIAEYKKEKNIDPILGKNFTGDQFFTDGNMYVLRLIAGY